MVKITLSCDSCKNSSTHPIERNQARLVQHVERYAAHHNTCTLRGDAREVCSCGWERPLIGLTMPDGSKPPPVVPIYDCPRCGETYVSSEVPEPEARRILAGFNSLRGRPTP